jgi:hypothetical protein
MDLSLTEEEARLLQHILSRYLPELRDEVYKTENYQWRQDLKHDEEVLKALIAKLEKAVPQTP